MPELPERCVPELQWFLAGLVAGGLDDKSWTQGQLARRAGITQKYMSELMNGHRMGTLAMWQRLLDILEVKVTS